jgi:predicted amidophosphoribosyltransferase
VSAVSAYSYTGPAVTFVRAWKERGLRHLAPLAAELVLAQLERPAADVITYIPPDRVRQLKRGRHPAQSLAQELAARWGIACEPLLHRTRVTERQATLPLARRGGNVRNLFAPIGVIPAHVVLIDDIYTSGSTASAAAGALRCGGATRVDVRTFARAVR